ncbi:hypothetical protein AB1Y20_009975, partial [Prymnesium parvum]
MRGVGPRQSRAQPPGRPLGNAPPVETALSIEGVRSGERGTPHGPGAVKSRPVAPGVTRGRTPNTPNTPSRSDRSSQEARSIQRAPSNDASPLSALVHQSSASLSSSGTTSLSSVYRASDRSQSSRQLDMLAVLQAAPLVYAGRPIDLLDHKAERDAIIASAQRAGRKVQVVCDFCTTRRMGALLTDGCRMLHYSGHGFTDIDRNGIQRTRLAFENEEGGTHALEVDKLTALVKAGADPSGGRLPLDLAVISACHSVGGGQAFVDAGVPHVIAVRREAQLQDKAACVFAGALYHALFKGRTVAAAFEIGKQAVANQPGILRAGEESEKFCLMPLDADHHVSLCADFPEGACPLAHQHLTLRCGVGPRGPSTGVRPTGLVLFALAGEAVVNTKHKVLHNLPAFFPLQFLGRQTEWQQIVAAAVGQDKRLLTLVGGPGIGKTALTVAVAHYLLERSTFNGGVFFARAQGTTTAFEVGASIRAALSDANVASDGDGDRKDVEATLPAELRRIGACLLVLDHWEPREATNSFLQTLLQSAPELRLLLSCTEALSFPGVGQRQVLLNPMPADEAGRLLRSLAPRPITRAEVGCDDKQNLRDEMQKLLNHFGSRVAGLDQFSLLSPPCTPVGELQNCPPLRVQWVLPNFVVANALYQELSAFPSKLQLDSPPPTASGRACLFGFISLPKMLSSHRLLDLLHGNPKAISLAASLLLSHNRSPRSLDQVFELLENPAEAAKSADLSDSCRTILEQFDAITNAQGSPSRSRGRRVPSMSGSIDASGVVEASGESTPTTPSSPAVEEAPWNGEALPPSLLLRPDEYKKMSKHPSIRSLGTGLFGSVYETELAGTKVALKRFHGNALSSTSFK